MHFENINNEKEYICSQSSIFCKFEIMSLVKKLKLSCDKNPMKPLKLNLNLNNLYMVSEKPVGKDYTFY